MDVRRDPTSVRIATVIGLVPLYLAYWAVSPLLIWNAQDAAPPASAGIALLLLAIGGVLLTAVLHRSLQSLWAMAYPSAKISCLVSARAVRISLWAGLTAICAFLAVLAASGSRGEDWSAQYVLAAVVITSGGISMFLSSWGLVAAIGVAGVVSLLIEADFHGSLSAALAVAVTVMTAQFSVWQLRIARQLQLARMNERALTAAEVRLRLSREVHDVAGRSLAAIAIKLELASRLQDREDPTSKQQMLEARRLADVAMKEMRQLSHGFRSVDLPTEVAAAVSLLSSAGISTEVKGEAADVPPHLAEPFAWAVREGVANILKHSRASSATITLLPESIEISNDAPLAPSGSHGTGLVGLQERMHEAGGDLLTRYDGLTFRLEASFPAARRVTTAGRRA